MRRWACAALAAVCLAALGLTPGAALVAAEEGATAPAAGGKAAALHDKIVQAYLHNRWAELKEGLAAAPAELAKLTAAQRDDVAYVRAAFADCRPEWWEKSKAGEKFPFRPTIWGRAFSATYSSQEKGGFRIETPGGLPALTVFWDPNELDSQQPPNDYTMAGHGTKQGDMAEVRVWMDLARTALITSFPMREFEKLYESDRKGYSLYELFVEQLAAVYHGSPRSRHAAMVMCFSSFMERYGRAPWAGTRRAIASMFVAQLLADPSRWPSIHLPAGLPADRPEAALAEHCIGEIDRGWALAEDRALREAALALYKANGRQTLSSGKVVLPNKLTSMLDPEKDADAQGRRDTWVVKQFQKAVSDQK